MKMWRFFYAQNKKQGEIKVENDVQTLLSFDDFIVKCRMMDEACCQWCCFIDDAPERRDGYQFTEFYKRSMRNT